MTTDFALILGLVAGLKVGVLLVMLDREQRRVNHHVEQILTHLRPLGLGIEPREQD